MGLLLLFSQINASIISDLEIFHFWEKTSLSCSSSYVLLQEKIWCWMFIYNKVLLFLVVVVFSSSVFILTYLWKCSKLNGETNSSEKCWILFCCFFKELWVLLTPSVISNPCCVQRLVAVQSTAHLWFCATFGCVSTSDGSSLPFPSPCPAHSPVGCKNNPLPLLSIISSTSSVFLHLLRQISDKRESWSV